MKYFTVLLLAIIFIGCNNKSGSKKQNTEGVEFYSGYLKCEECGNVLVRLELRQDNTCVMSDTDLDGIPETKLTFGTWKKEANKLHIKSGMFNITFNVSGNKISISFDENYTTVLEKQIETIDLTQPFIARGEFFYYADASTFTICNSQRYPVAHTEAHFDAEKLFLGKAEEKLYLDMLITIETKPNQDKVLTEQVFIHKVLNEAPGCL